MEAMARGEQQGRARRAGRFPLLSSRGDGERPTADPELKGHRVAEWANERLAPEVPGFGEEQEQEGQRQGRLMRERNLPSITRNTHQSQDLSATTTTFTLASCVSQTRTMGPARHTYGRTWARQRRRSFGRHRATGSMQVTKLFSPAASRARGLPLALAATCHCLLLGLLTLAVTTHGQQPQFVGDPSLAAEPRASDGGLASVLKPPLGNANNANNIALNQLVSFLNSMQQQQQQQQQNNGNNPRRSPLPLGQLGGLGNGQRPMLVQQPTPSSSTPANPFVAAINFQPTRRQQQAPQQPFSGQPLTPQPPVSSSSPPALTLNRIAPSPQFQQSPAGVQFAGQSPRFTNSQQLKPINTIPLGAYGNNNNNNQNGNIINNNLASNRLPQPPPSNQRRPQVQNGGQGQGPPQRSPLMPPPTQAAPAGGPSQGIRPLLTGFAPSGPPPSSATNTAINVVQSPPNVIGQPPSPFEMPLMSGGGAPSRGPSSTEPAPTTTSTTTITTTSSQRPSSPASVESSSSNPPSGATPVPVTVTQAPSTPTSERPPSTPSAGSSPSPAQDAATASTMLTMISSSEPTLGQQAQTSQSTSAQASTSSSGPEPASEPTPAPTTTVASEQAAAASWSPVQLATNRTRNSGTSLAPSPDIVTVPPGYNPDAPAPPQSYDIAVSAQMGGGRSAPPSAGPTDNQQAPRPVESAAVTPTSSESATPALTSSVVLATAAPTETTTIIWSSETTSAAPTSLARPAIQATRTHQPHSQQTHVSSTAAASLAQPPLLPPPPPPRIRDSSMMQSDDPGATTDQGVVYGKAPSREAKPTRPPPQEGQQHPLQQAGRPSIQTAQLDMQVRPFSAGTQPVKSNHGGSVAAPFKPSRPLNGNGAGGGMNVGSGFSIAASGNQTMPTGDIQDYVAGAPPPIVSMSDKQQPAAGSGAASDGTPTISAQGGPDPATFDLAAEGSSASVSSRQQADSEAGVSSTTPAPAPRLRRPTFKPKPAVPPIRIDSCIVGDDSSCDQSHNERCVTEYGISSCHCKPGFARLSQLRGYCSPISLLQFNLKIDKLSDDRRLAYNSSLEDPNSEQYQYLEFETVQALAGAMQQTSLARHFMGARVNKFYERKNRVWANVSVNLELNNLTRNEPKVQQVAHSELLRLAQQRGRPLGESTIMLDGSRESVSKLTDVNECASRELNDCSKHATCTNEFGGYSCQCLAGFEDKALVAAAAAATAQGASDNSTAPAAPHELKARLGRVCMGCSAAYCSNRGECFIQDGRKQCKCRANFMGSRCDIDSEVLAVAIGGSLVGLVILIITFWCLFVYNRRWRREQKKMDAVSATSGLTYNYVNSNGTSSGLMSPAVAAGHGRAQPGALLGGAVSGRSAAAAYTMGHRRGGGGGYHADQQAIIGSTSSGSSAASQPIACNPYAAGAYSGYEDGLLIAPASTGSSEQTSPSANSYRGIIGGSGNTNHSAAMLAAAGNAYTLSGHHHHHGHHHLNQQQHHLQQQQMMQQQQLAAAAAHHLHQQQQHHGGKQLTQFHPSAMMDAYASRTLTAQNNYCPQPTLAHHQHQAANGYDSRWRTLQQADNKQGSLAGYYLVR